MLPQKKTLADIFAYEHNWVQSYKFTYGYSTVIIRGRARNEQRKSMNIPPSRSVEMVFLTEYDQTTEVLNWLRYYQSSLEQVVQVPLYHEPIRTRIVSDMFGLSVVTTNDISYYKNLQDLSSDLLFIDKSWVQQPTVEAIASVQNDSITLTNFVSKHYVGRTTIIYPLMNAVITQHSIQHITDRWSSVRLFAQEVLDVSPVVGIGAS